MKITYRIVLKNADGGTRNISKPYKSRVKAIWAFEELKKRYPNAVLMKVKDPSKGFQLPQIRSRKNIITLFILIIVSVVVGVGLSYMMNEVPNSVNKYLTGEIERQKESIKKELVKNYKDKYKDLLKNSENKEALKDLLDKAKE
ncbi:MAG: hypothetical protein ACE5QV_06495 [Fidelibacterota bacterium]